MASLFKLGRTTRSVIRLRTTMCNYKYVPLISESVLLSVTDHDPRVQRTATSKPDLNGLRSRWGPVSFNVDKMTEVLDHDNLEMRRDMRKLLGEPDMVPRYNMTLSEEREVAFDRLKRVCRAGFISV